MVNSGAHHVVGLLFLGSNVDAEPNGLPWPRANGDDLAGGFDDENGVRFNGWIVPGQMASITIQSSGSGFLDAWIDFQANGNWSDPMDRIFTSQAVVAGFNNFTFSVPVGLVNGTYSYARFRLSSAGGLLPTGLAVDGECEDYEVIIGTHSQASRIVDQDAGLSYAQNEIPLAIDSGSSNIIAAYNDNPFPNGPGLGYSYSTNSGVSWTSGQLAMPINAISSISMVDAFDPSVTYDAMGNAFIAHIATDFDWTNGPESGLYVHRSANAGATWSIPVTVSLDSGAMAASDTNFRFNDRCQIKADIGLSSPKKNNVYVTWIKDRGWNLSRPLSDIYFSASTDNGASFSMPVQVNNSTNDLGNLPIHAIASNGDIYLLWVDYNVQTGGTGVLFLDRSTDGGTTWGTDLVVDTIQLPPLNLNGSGVRAKGAAIIRTDPTNSSTLYIAYAADPDTLGPDEGDIFFIRSANAGVTWSTPLRVNDNSGTTDQVLPWMEVAPNGIIDIAWYDRRNDPLDQMWDVYGSTTIDGGLNFAANTKVNATSFANPQTQVGPWFGEYLGLTASNSVVYVAYTSSLVDAQGDVFFGSFNNPTPLPVELLRFGARLLTKCDVEIYWETSSEMNSDYFIIEKSQDEEHWTQVARVQALGRSQQTSSYRHTDRLASKGLWFYRLKMVDIDGSSNISEVKQVRLDCKSNDAVKFSPNPATEFIRVIKDFEGELELHIMDLSGRHILTKKIRSKEYLLDLQELSSGLYLIELEGKYYRDLKLISKF